jgi:uncharacterized membrane protein (UPF0127 family)
MKLHFRTTKKVTLIALAVFALVVLSYGYRCGNDHVCGTRFVTEIFRPTTTITTSNGKTIVAEVAQTQGSREQGLSGRDGLSDGEGMLFIFDTPGRYAFWMKDMTFAIDIIWIAEDGTIVYSEKNVLPSTYFDHTPPQAFMNSASAKYVLEIKANASDAYGLYLGTKVKIQ